MFHILYPEVKVAGRITRAHPLSSVAEVKEEDRGKFGQLLSKINEVRERGRGGHFSRSKFTASLSV